MTLMRDPRNLVTKNSDPDELAVMVEISSIIITLKERIAEKNLACIIGRIERKNLMTVVGIVSGEYPAKDIEELPSTVITLKDRIVEKNLACIIGRIERKNLMTVVGIVSGEYPAKDIEELPSTVTMPKVIIDIMAKKGVAAAN
jgi:phosphoribosylamine-glycine ligase